MNTTPHLDSALRATAGRLRLHAVLRAALLGATVVVATLLLAVALDAVIALPANARVLVDALLIACAAGAVAIVITQFARHQYDARRTARLVEQRLGVADNRFINSVDLAERDARARGSDELAGLAVTRGERVAGEIEPGAVADAKPVWRALQWACVAAVAVVLLGLVPGLYRAVLPRLVEPFADHPPFTLVTFDVIVEPEPVFHGKPASIAATLGGPQVPPTADVVFIAEDETTRRVPMLRRDESKFVLPIDRAESSSEFYIDTPQGRSKRHVLNVRQTPLIERVTVRYEPPAYTGRPAGQVELGPDGVRGLRGTTVTMTIQSNVPLLTAKVLPIVGGVGEPTSEGVKRHADDEKRVSWTFNLDFVGQRPFAVALVGLDGTIAEKPLAGGITSVPDAAPRVRFDEPGEPVVAVEGWPVRVRVFVDDDVGVSSVELQHALGEDEMAATHTWADLNSPLQMTPEHTFDLKAMNVKSGDVVRYRAIATDNRPAAFGGPQTAVSKTFTIEVITLEEYRSLKRGQYGPDDMRAEAEQIQRLLDDLSRRRAQLAQVSAEMLKRIEAQSGTMTDADKQARAGLLDAVKRYEDAARRLGQRAGDRADQPTLYDFEADYARQLKQLAEQLNAQADGVGDARDSFERDLEDQPRQGDARTAQFLKDLNDLLQSGGQQMQDRSADLGNVSDDLSKLGQADALMREAQTIVRIADRQALMAERFKTIKAFEQADQLAVDAEELSARQDSIRRSLDEALQRLEGLANESREATPKMAASADDIVRAIREAKVELDQASAAKAAGERQWEAAHSAAAAAARKLNEMIQDAPEGLQDDASADLDQSLKLLRSNPNQGAQQLSQRHQPPQLSNQTNNNQQDPTGAAAAARSRAKLVGPHAPQGSDDAHPVGRSGTGDTTAAAGNDLSHGFESLDPDSAAFRAGVKAALTGVPLRDRAKAEAYLRRVARESQ